MKLSTGALLLCAGALWLHAATASAESIFTYFGTYTNALSRGIYVARLDPATGRLSTLELAAATPSPCFLAVSPDGTRLYAANSVPVFGGVKTGAASAFRIDHTTGHLTLLNQAATGGAGPCHVSVDQTGKTLLVANYAGGSVMSLALNQDGRLGSGNSFYQYSGHSVNPTRQTSPHAHFICPDPANHYALACDLGTDKVMIYKLTNGVLTANEPPFASVPPGAGARHLAFSGDGKFAYVANEMGGTITTFAWDGAKGTLDLIETVSALPAGVAMRPDYTAAEFLTSGHFVYVTVRGHDSVSVLAADAHNGRLTLVQNLSAGGQIPRGLGIDPTGRWLIVANQKSNNVVVFGIAAATGKLSPTGQELKIGAPVDVKFVPQRPN